jgi:uncharacterized protein with PQ loop repeat
LQPSFVLSCFLFLLVLTYIVVAGIPSLFLAFVGRLILGLWFTLTGFHMKWLDSHTTVVSEFVFLFFAIWRGWEFSKSFHFGEILGGGYFEGLTLYPGCPQTQSFCLSLPSARIIGKHHHTWLIKISSSWFFLLNNSGLKLFLFSHILLCRCSSTCYDYSDKPIITWKYKSKMHLIHLAYWHHSLVIQHTV